jgi:hypothetical protein
MQIRQMGTQELDQNKIISLVTIILKWQIVRFIFSVLRKAKLVSHSCESKIPGPKYTTEYKQLFDLPTVWRQQTAYFRSNSTDIPQRNIIDTKEEHTPVKSGQFAQ